jgi:YbbR domain-containing protein
MIEFVRNLIFRDFLLKLLSLVFATLIWLTVWFAISKDVSPLTTFGSHAVEKSFYNVPVLVIFPAGDIRTVTVEPSVVQVTVQGQPKMIDNLRPEDIRAQVDLTGIESARGLRKRIELTLPTGVIHTRIVPHEVEVMVPPRQ